MQSRSPLFVSVENDFGVGRRPELMAGLDQLAAQLRGSCRSHR